MVQDNVLSKIPDEELEIFVVWEPILRTDKAVAARKATTLFDDPRVENFWVETQSVGELFQPVIKLKTEPAWDVYLVYGRDAKWKGERPPKPASFMHQLGGRLPDANRLDGAGLARRIEAALRRGGR